MWTQSPTIAPDTQASESVTIPQMARKNTVPPPQRPKHQPHGCEGEEYVSSCTTCTSRRVLCWHGQQWKALGTMEGQGVNNAKIAADLCEISTATMHRIQRECRSSGDLSEPNHMEISHITRQCTSRRISLLWSWSVSA